MNADNLIAKAEAVKTSEYGYTDGWIDEAVAMLRQQQAEIEALKQQLVTTSSEAKLNYNKGHEDGCKLEAVEQITDEEMHQAIRRGFSKEGFLSDGILLEIKELLKNKQGVNSEQVPDFFFMENDLMGKR